MATMPKKRPTTPNAIARLRQAKRWPMSRLAEEMGKSISAVNSLEKGEKVLDVEDLRKLARIFGVDWYEIADEPRTAGGMAEDAAPFEADASNPLHGWRLQPNQYTYIIKSHAVDGIGLAPGDEVIVDGSQKAVDALQLGDIVIARLNGRTIVRQFIEPELLVTNSRTENDLPLHRTRDDVAIVGVIVRRLGAVGARQH